MKSTLTSVAAQSAGASDVEGASASAPMLEGAGVQLVSPTAVRFYPSLKSDNYDNAILPLRVTFDSLLLRKPCTYGHSQNVLIGVLRYYIVY